MPKRKKYRVRKRIYNGLYKVKGLTNGIIWSEWKTIEYFDNFEQAEKYAKSYVTWSCQTKVMYGEECLRIYKKENKNVEQS